MILFIIICIVIVLALIPLMVAGIFRANQKKLEQIKNIELILSAGEVERQGLRINGYPAIGYELRALDEAYYLRDQIEATKDTRRTALANTYIRKIERIVNERTA